MVLDKFIPPFIDFIHNNFESSNHRFMILGKEKYEYGLTKSHIIEWIDKKAKLLHLYPLYIKQTKLLYMVFGVRE